MQLLHGAKAVELGHYAHTPRCSDPTTNPAQSEMPRCSVPTPPNTCFTRGRCASFGAGWSFLSLLQNWVSVSGDQDTPVRRCPQSILPATLWHVCSTLCCSWCVPSGPWDIASHHTVFYILCRLALAPLLTQKPSVLRGGKRATLSAC